MKKKREDTTIIATLNGAQVINVYNKPFLLQEVEEELDDQLAKENILPNREDK